VSLKITPREVDGVTILDVVGRITLGKETGMLRETVRGLAAQGKKKILLNLAQVDYLDSTGVGELVGSFTTVRNSGGELKLLNLSQKVNDVLPRHQALHRLRCQGRRVHRGQILRLVFRQVACAAPPVGSEVEPIRF